MISPKRNRSQEEKKEIVNQDKRIIAQKCGIDRKKH